jgi:hypothetical protein
MSDSTQVSGTTWREVVVFGCHIDLGPDERPDGCVFDSGDICDCRIAETLQAAGKGRDACEHWRPVTLTKYETVSDILQSREALRASHGALVKALTRLLTRFPTDDDMAGAGWETSAINEACNAYDDARAALAVAQKVTA